MADLAAADIAREGAVTGHTHDNQACALRRFEQYLQSVGLSDDPFLDGFTCDQQNRIMCAFAMAMREGRFSGPAYDRLAKGTVRDTMSYVCSTFRENGRPNPTKDSDLQPSFILSRLYRAFANKDPNEIQQKAIPPCVILALATLMFTETQQAIGQLATLAFFFAMRSCEYLKVPQVEKGRTEILRLRNLRFIRDGQIVSHDDPNLHTADCLAITFEMQKKDDKHDTVNHHATPDTTLCPVKAAAAIVKRIKSYPGTNNDTPISTVLDNSRLTHVTSKQVTDALRDSVKSIGENFLNINADEIGTRSIRSGAAMAMFIGGCPVYLIMLIGRWSNDAFLRYIRKQVEQFSHDVSSRMITQMFSRYIPSMESRVSDMDPRTRNNPNNAKTQRNVGGNASRQARLPAFSQFT